MRSRMRSTTDRRQIERCEIPIHHELRRCGVTSTSSSAPRSDLHLVAREVEGSPRLLVIVVSSCAVKMCDADELAILVDPLEIGDREIEEVSPT
jgi:hypothetical protein